MKRIVLSIGDVVISSEPAILETVLGSCVSVCLWDEKTKTGGMNHFMLPELMDELKSPSRYGPESISRLVEDFRQLASDLRNVKAKIFGGGKVVKELVTGYGIGERNIRLAKDVLKEYRIPVINEFTGADSGIKVVFYTATGRAFAKKIKD